MGQCTFIWITGALWPKFAGRVKTPEVLLKRRILFPWLLSTVVMAAISYVWHGLALTDITDLRMDFWLYLGLSSVAYLVIGLILTLAIHFGIAREWISLKTGFPLKSMLVGGGIGILIYLVVLLSGLSFASHGVQHVVVDLIWQIVEQSIGGLMVSLGIIYDMHRSFMEAEQAH